MGCRVKEGKRDGDILSFSRPDPSSSCALLERKRGNKKLTRRKTITTHLLGVPREETLCVLNHILSLIIRWMASVDRSDWFITSYAGKSMSGHFLQYKRHMGALRHPCQLIPLAYLFVSVILLGTFPCQPFAFSYFVIFSRYVHHLKLLVLRLMFSKL